MERVGKMAGGERVLFFVEVARSVTYDNVDDVIVDRRKRGNGCKKLPHEARQLQIPTTFRTNKNRR